MRGEKIGNEENVGKVTLQKCSLNKKSEKKLLHNPPISCHNKITEMDLDEKNSPLFVTFSGVSYYALFYTYFAVTGYL